MSKYQLTTTMHAAGYELYGKRMIDNFLKFWPESQKLMVYTEGFDLIYSQKSNPRIVSRDLLTASPDLVTFKQRHKNNPRANGFVNPDRRDPDFVFDAVRFSHKVFALYHAVHNRLPGSEAVVWVDADTLTHAPIPETFLVDNFPLNADVGIYYLGRSQQHSECGWMVFNCNNSYINEFWEKFADQYRKDYLFELNEWHDSYIFDHVRKLMENAGMTNSNITPGYVRGHPFIDSFLGEYMDHLKGPKRKASGRSAKHEAKNKTAKWWK